MNKQILHYVKGVYMRGFQSKIESFKDSTEEEKKVTIQAQDLLMIDRSPIE